MNGDRMRIRIGRSAAHSFALLALVEVIDERGERSVGTLTFDPAPPNGAIGDRLIDIPDETAQELADNLWDLGFRPRGAAGSAGQLDAVQAHLGDMKRIAFGFLDGKTRLGGEGPKDLQRVAAMAAALGRLAAGDIAGAASVLEEALRP